LLGEQVEGGALPSWGFTRGQLDATWPMVSASFLPLVAVVLARLAGASALAATNVGLVTVLVLVTAHSWAAGRSAQLRGRQLLFATLIAAGLGLAMILLKDVVLTQVH
jgi:hypothetical protein